MSKRELAKTHRAGMARVQLAIHQAKAIAGSRSRLKTTSRKRGFKGLNVLCSEDPLRKIAAWRKECSELLLISEHDIRV